MAQKSRMYTCVYSSPFREVEKGSLEKDLSSVSGICWPVQIGPESGEKVAIGVGSSLYFMIGWVG